MKRARNKRVPYAIPKGEIRISEKKGEKTESDSGEVKREGTNAEETKTRPPGRGGAGGAAKMSLF